MTQSGSRALQNCPRLGYTNLFMGEARMRRGRLHTALRIAVSTAIGLSLALTANDPTLAQPSPRQTTPARSPADAAPYPLEGDAVSGPPSAPATAHAVACSENFGKDSNHL